MSDHTHKVIMVKRCAYCPYFKWDIEHRPVKNPYCKKESRKVPHGVIMSFPDWCPLKGAHDKDIT